MQTYQGQNVTGWHVSEKLDGVFARWGGRFLFSRDWVLFTAPDSLCAGLDPCEGEVWHPEGLERVQGCRQWAATDPRWQGVRFIPHASIPHETVRDADHLRAFYDVVIARGGEGVVIRNPYSGEMLKLKPDDDAEAVVTGYTTGSGRNANRVGSLLVQWRGLDFGLSVGLTPYFRSNPPPVGSLVTFAYSGTTERGLPRSARFVRVRVDA